MPLRQRKGYLASMLIILFHQKSLGMGRFLLGGGWAKASEGWVIEKYINFYEELYFYFGEEKGPSF